MKYIVTLCFALTIILVGCQKDNGEETYSAKAAPKIEMNKETKEKLFVLPNYRKGNVTYSGSEFKKGMARKEVLNTYGKPNTKFKTVDKTYEIYGNVGLYYEEDELEDVVYYADADKKTVIDTLGKPDREVEKDGLYELSYLLKDGDKEETHLVLWSKDNKQIGPITIEVLNDDSDKKKITSTEKKKDKSNPKPKNEDEAVEQFMESYVEDLVSFYNGKKDKIKSIESGSPAERKVKKNKESGNFKNQRSLDVRLIKYTYYNDDYDVTIERGYTYDKSSNKKTTTINYKLKKTGNTYKVLDFSEQ